MSTTEHFAAVAYRALPNLEEHAMPDPRESEPVSNAELVATLVSLSFMLGAEREISRTRLVSVNALRRRVDLIGAVATEWSTGTKRARTAEATLERICDLLGVHA
jgi:hypothetical protein